MDTDGTDIDPYTKVIPPYMVLTYASDYDSNSKINRDSDYKLEDNDDNILGAKKNSGRYLYDDVSGVEAGDRRCRK